MTFVHILPTNMINENMIRQDFEMYLTDQILRHKETYSFLGNDKLKGINSYKILDNSAFELGEGLTMEKVLEAAKVIDANEIILPDIVGSTESFKKTMKALNEIDLKKCKYSIAAVVQGDNYASRKDCIHKLFSIKAIKTIMIPKICPDRHLLVREIEDCKMLYHRPEVQIHLLGLRNEGLTELMYPEIKEYVRSVDSGYFMAISNKYYESLNLLDERPRDCKINLDNMVVNQEIFEKNIKKVNKILEL